jgi:hypothetical protein
LLYIMAHGSFEGRGVDDPCIRRMFTREALLASDWYRERLHVKQDRDSALWTRHVESLERYAASIRAEGLRDEIGACERLGYARTQLARVASAEYLEELVGTIGADPLRGQ